MKEYIIGFLFVIALSLLVYSLGSVIINKEKSDGYKLMVGYLIYSFFIGLSGMIIQFFNIPWKIYFYIVILWMIGIVLFIVYQVIIKHKKIFYDGIKEYIKNNYFLFIVTILLMAVFMLTYNALWFGNHLDDGYYITKIADLPYVKDPYTFNYSTGFQDKFSLERILNTHELELSVYVYLLRMSPSLFTRFFMSGLHYFVFANSLSAFAYAILKKINKDFNYYLVQFVPTILLLFSFNENFIRYFNIAFFFDSNQFANAIYFGSSVVRVMSFIFLLTPFIESKKVDFKMILCVVGISVVLMSKSSIALPLIILISLFYVITTLVFMNKKYLSAILLFGLFIVVSVCASLFTDVSRMQNCVHDDILLVNIHSILLLTSYAIIILSYLLKNKYVNRMSTILLLLLVFTQTPILSGLYYATSIYAFVSCRGLTLINYTCIMYAFILIVYFTSKIRFSQVLYSVICLCLFATSVFSYHLAGGSLFFDEHKISQYSLVDALKVIAHNPEFMPETTIELGYTLQNYAEDNNKELNVIMTRLILSDGTAHALPIILRTYCPSEKIHIISALYRYANPSTTKFKDFKEEDQSLFEAYTVNPSQENYEKLKNMVDTYDINCLVMPNNSYDADVKNLGYTLLKCVTNDFNDVTHYIYVR